MINPTTNPNQTRRWLQSHTRSIIVVVLLLTALLGILLLSAVGSILDKRYSNLISVTCIYQGQVVVFLDKNGDGIQQADEPGITGVSLTLKYTDPLYFETETPEVIISNSAGQIFYGKDFFCPADDALILSVTLPLGYSATTSLTFGPYAIPNFAAHTPSYPPPPIPTAIYVGLRKN